jgi:short-subunit dehydrogenase involved in D-alanine esterification of teichoic acids
VRVIELIPPIVKTNLHRDLAQQPPRTTPPDRFVIQAMKALDQGSDEAAVRLAQRACIAPKRLLAIVN